MQHPRLLKGLLSAGRPRVLAESAAFGFICFVASPVLIIYLNRNL